MTYAHPGFQFNVPCNTDQLPAGHVTIDKLEDYPTSNPAVALALRVHFKPQVPVVQKLSVRVGEFNESGQRIRLWTAQIARAKMGAGQFAGFDKLKTLHNRHRGGPLVERTQFDDQWR